MLFVYSKIENDLNKIPFAENLYLFIHKGMCTT